MTIQRTKRAALIISESGLQSLTVAGITTGWLKAWLLSAGAGDVVIYLLGSDDWHDTAADAGTGVRLFFGSEAELKSIERLNDDETSDIHSFSLGDPERRCRSFNRQGRQVVLLPLGDIAYQRQDWLYRLNEARPLLALYILADDSLDISLEPGLSASLSKPADGRFLNAEGLLIEEQVIATLKEYKLSIRTVESCTAGGIAARLCRIPGASEVVDRGWVTYTNRAKQEEVGVEADVLELHGAVSEAVVEAMAEGGADASHICISVSGIAGPDGGTDEKPVGTVWVAVAMAGQSTLSQCLHLTGARHEIQSRSVIAALNFLLTSVDKFHHNP